MRKTIAEVAEEFRGKHIAIVGNGPSANRRDFSEYDRPIWTVSGGWQLHPNSVLGWFMDDIHGPAVTVLGPQYSEARKVEFKNTKIPIITSTAYPHIYPTTIDYPLAKVIEHFDLDQPYFSETTNYMLAFAIMIGVKAIDFFGVDYIGCRPAERASCEFWAGVAKGRGIKLYVTKESHFLRTQALNGETLHVPDMYGYLPQNIPVKYRELGNGTIQFDK